MSKRAENKEIIRKRILERAIPLFEEWGYNRVTLEDIAQAAQVSTRTLYRYFPKKLDILLGFVEVKMGNLAVYAAQTTGDLKNRVLDIMVFDYGEMYYRYDMSQLFETVHDKENQITECRVRNERRRENMFRDLILEEQSKYGRQNIEAAKLASGVICAIFFYCGNMLHRDQLRRLPSTAVKNYYRRYIDIVWESIEDMAGIGNPKEKSTV